MRSADREALDRLLATGHIPAKDAAAAIDATMRPPRARVHRQAETLPSGRGAGATVTGPFLPSITLAEAATDAQLSSPTNADLLVTTLLGEGGMGVVHTATQRSLDRSVAIKRPIGDAGDGLVEEARTMARVEHPNVVPVHALGRDARDRPVLVMKRVQGASFRDLLRDDAHPSWPMLIARWGDRERAALGILGEVADALELAHARGIVHRDVKPENVMVGEFGEVYLLDWGIARRLDEPAPDTGNIVGTPGYLAPEMVLSPDDVDARTDVYLLGATLHEILTGTLRHRGSSLYETLGLALESAPIAYDGDVPADLAALANQATSLDRDARPKSAAAFRSALREHERHREALGLVHDAHAALAPLVTGALALADPAAMPLLSEAGAALSAALRAYPDGGAVRAAMDEHLVLSIERDLAIESPTAARAHLAQLATPRPDLAERIDALETRLARAKASDAALAAARAEADTSSALRTRMLVLAGAFLPIALVTLLLGTTGLAGGAELTPRGILTTDAILVGSLFLGAFLARERLFANRGNRALTWSALGAFVCIATSNGLGVALGHPPNEVLAHTYVVIGAVFATAAALLHPLFVAGALSSVTVAALMAIYPAQAGVLSPVGMIAAACVGIGATALSARRTT